MQSLRKEHKSRAIKLFCILNSIIGAASFSYSIYEVADSCGLKYLTTTFAFLFYSLMNSIMYRSQTKWSNGLLLTMGVINLAVISISIGFIVVVQKQSLCGYQWCATGDVDSIQFLEDAESNFPPSCDQTPQQIGEILATYAFMTVKYQSIDELYYFQESISILLLSFMVASSILFEILLLAIIILRKKPVNPQQQQLLQP